MSDVLVKQKDGSFRRGFASEKRKGASYVCYDDYDVAAEWVNSEMIIVLEEKDITKELSKGCR